MIDHGDIPHGGCPEPFERFLVTVSGQSARSAAEEGNEERYDLGTHSYLLLTETGEGTTVAQQMPRTYHATTVACRPARSGTSGEIQGVKLAEDGCMRSGIVQYLFVHVRPNVRDEERVFGNNTPYGISDSTPNPYPTIRSLLRGG